MPSTVTKPEALLKRGGGGYSRITFKVLHAIMNNTGERLPCSILNKDAVKALLDHPLAGDIDMGRVNRVGAGPY